MGPHSAKTAWAGTRKDESSRIHGVWISSSTPVFSREYETLEGDLIGDVDSAMGDRIDAALKYDWEKKHKR